MATKSKKYIMIVTEEDERYGRGKQLGFFSENPHEGLLTDIVCGDTWDELFGDGKYEGLFYQLYDTESGYRIGRGILDPDSPEEEIEEFEKGGSMHEELSALYNVYCALYEDQLVGAEEEYEEFFTQEFAPPSKPWHFPEAAEHDMRSLLGELYEERTDMDELLEQCGLTKELAEAFHINI